MRRSLPNRSRSTNPSSSSASSTAAVPLPTALSVLQSGTHGRERRLERQIHKVDLQRARRYGMEEKQRNGRIRYTYKGIVFIYDPYDNREVTSFPSKDANRPQDHPHNHFNKNDPIGRHSQQQQQHCISPTKPVRLELKPEHNTDSAKLRHCLKRTEWNRDPSSSWTSHSVLVVDMSGSMRRDDVPGARCRSDAVWFTLARDFVARQLLSSHNHNNYYRTTTSATTASPKERNVVSVVVMRDGKATIPFQKEPLDWYLYNQFVQMREWSTMRPRGQGNFFPALQTAAKLLELSEQQQQPLSPSTAAASSSSLCALSLLVVSDGRPSDRPQRIKDLVADMAKRYRRRLTFLCLGVAASDDRFSLLQELVLQARAYGCVADFHQQPQLLGLESLSHAITTFASSVSQSQTELTSVRAEGNNKHVRVKSVVAERRDAPDDVSLTDQWKVYSNASTSRYVQRVWAWSHQRNDFCYLQDPRCVGCFRECTTSFSVSCQRQIGRLCPHCQTCVVCTDCEDKRRNRNNDDDNDDDKGGIHTAAQCFRFLQDCKSGKLIKSNPLPSWSVALKTPIWGEGAERIVRKIRCLNERGAFHGPKMVAKESRFIDMEDHNYYQRMNYHREFLRTQSLASELAQKFNSALDRLEQQQQQLHPPVASNNKNRRTMPRIQFLEPLVLEVMEDGHEFNILVEPMLEGTYEKFNNNMGYVKKEPSSNESSSMMMSLLLQQRNELEQLDAIVEEDTENDPRNDNNEQPQPQPQESLSSEEEGRCLFHSSDFPQAFSHFTYEVSNRQLMVVDLQGVYSAEKRVFVLTDPVIHKRRSNKVLRNWSFGRTDRGLKGIKAFFQTHQCSPVCQMLGLCPRGTSLNP